MLLLICKYCEQAFFETFDLSMLIVGFLFQVDGFERSWKAIVYSEG